MSEGSRRDLFWWLGAASAVSLGAPVMAQTASRAAPENLTQAEADILAAFCDRLVPSDAHGPGATEARAAHYIDRALGGALAASREEYRSGLAALDVHAQKTQGKNFAGLTPEAQDAVLTDMEKNIVPGFAGAAIFFALVHGHTFQGMFGDPYYGGNDHFIGWTLIGYPGIRLAVSKEDQAMNAHLTPVLKSAYDFPMFNKAADDRATRIECHRAGSGRLDDAQGFRAR
jgi:gluconate 2-dehydrogenase gamma chain